jgi:hypothetical protein
MSALSIQPTYPIFTDVDGQPLEDGFLWIGAVNLDPQTNPVAVFWDAALTLPAVQPIRTLAGYPANSGTPARLYVNNDYSIRVMNKNGSTVYSSLAATERYNASVITSFNITAQDVVYSPPGVGSVETNAGAKLDQIVQLTDFMTPAEIADANSDTMLYDHTTAFQNFVNHVVVNQMSGHINVRNVHITQPILMNGGVVYPPGSGKSYRLFGDGPTGTSISELNTGKQVGVRTNPVARLLDFSDQAGPAIVIEKFSLLGPEQANGVGVPVYGGTGVYLHNSNGIVFRDIWPRGLTIGFDKTNTSSTIFFDYCIPEFCVTGIVMSNGDQCGITNLVTYENLTDVYFTGNTWLACIFSNITCLNSNSVGIHLHNCSNLTINTTKHAQNGFFAPGSHNSRSIYFTGVCDNNRIDDVYSFDCGIETINCEVGSTVRNNWFSRINVRGGTNFIPPMVTLEPGSTGNHFTDCNVENTTYGIVDRGGDNKYTNCRAFNNSVVGVVLNHGPTNAYFDNCEIIDNAQNWSIAAAPSVWINTIRTVLDAGFTPGRHGSLGAGGGRTFYAPSAPLIGTYVVGDRVINTVPTVGQPKAWVCTVAGTPGTWVSEGNL